MREAVLGKQAMRQADMQHPRRTRSVIAYIACNAPPGFAIAVSARKCQAAREEVLVALQP
jgi:hypothetical protein